MRSHARRWVLLATILGSSIAFMMASIINVALPAIQETYGATVAQMQWVASAYTVLLAALTLAGGAIGDRFGGGGCSRPAPPGWRWPRSRAAWRRTRAG